MDTHPRAESEPQSSGLDHAGLEILDGDECRQLLANAAVARLAFVEDGAPVVLPINIGWWQGDIVFSTERGSKLEAAINRHEVAIEVDGWDAADQTGWSVLVKGTASIVEHGRDIDALDRIAIQSWIKPGVPKHWVAVVPGAISGRRTSA